jgi:predicted nucleic acid-binding Zn ribbon protein
MEVEFEIRHITCPECGAKIVTASPKRRFCSAKCRRRYLSRVRRVRLFADPEVKRASLERLLAWKEAHRKAKADEANA